MYQFNDNRKEVSFDKSNTPTPWMNYLSNGEFTAMISQAGGGVAFYKSPQIWRINHYRFFIFLQTAAVFILTLRTERVFGVLPQSRQKAVRESGRPLTEWAILHMKRKEEGYS